jgi:hypothetical protein
MKNNIQNSLVFFFLIFFASCSTSPILGTWQYDGGIYNGREQKASPDFQMQRTYDDNSFEAFMIEGKAPPELYSSGIYEVKGDTLLITSKFSSRPSQNTDVVITYKFSIKSGKLTINGVLPNGMIVEEYWKKIK